MNWSPPRLIGTPPFRALASSFAPAAVAAGFRPVVAGQYLRETADVDALEFVFLEPAARTRVASNWSITITPQLIWQQLSGAEPRGAKSSVAANTTEVTPNTHTSRETSHSSNSRETRLVGQSDRLLWLQEFARWVSSQRDVNERRHDGPRTHLASTTITQLRQDSATRTERNSRLNAFQPVSLTFRQGADHSSHSVSSSSVDTRDREAFQQREIVVHSMAAAPPGEVPQSGWHTRFVNHSGGDPRSTNHPFASHSSPPLFLTQQSQRVLARFATNESERHAFNSRTVAGEVRRTALPPIAFGGVATLAIDQPANLVPRVYQTVHRDAGDASEAPATTTVVIRGAGSAEAFANAVTRRFSRSAQTASDVDAPAAVSTIVRLAASPPASPTPAAMPVTTVMQSVSQPGPAPPGHLTPALMQQLTEQVVRALDARALAERERRGGF